MRDFILKRKEKTSMFDQLFGIMQEFEDGLGILTDVPKGS